jgi:hypothetical protein
VLEYDDEESQCLLSNDASFAGYPEGILNGQPQQVATKNLRIEFNSVLHSRLSGFVRVEAMNPIPTAIRLPSWRGAAWTGMPRPDWGGQLMWMNMW